MGAAVSGGADSVALLHLLLDLRAELGIVLSVVHFNHKLRGNDSDEDERFVAELAREHQLEFFAESGDVATLAEQKHLGIEAAAREMRYGYVSRLLRADLMDRIATAHTLDDQAETVLLRLARGTGTRGLAGIYPLKTVAGRRSPPDIEAEREEAAIIRPLLGARRPALESYLRSRDQSWREDASNRDLRHARNRVRHVILPQLERTLSPSVRRALAETAEIARAEEAYWAHAVGEAMPRVWEQAQARLMLAELGRLPPALQRRVVRAACESLGLNVEFKHVEETLAVAAGEASAAALPKGWQASGEAGAVYFRFVDTASFTAYTDFDYALPVPGRVEVPEAAVCFETSLVSRASESYNPEDLLSAEYAGRELRVRNWRPGDRFWPAHAKDAKKVKDLLQKRRVTGAERKLWPVVVSGTEVLWIRGFSARSTSLQDDGEAVIIREIRLKQ